MASCAQQAADRLLPAAALLDIGGVDLDSLSQGVVDDDDRADGVVEAGLEVNASHGWEGSVDIEDEGFAGALCLGVGVLERSRLEGLSSACQDHPYPCPDLKPLDILHLLQGYSSQRKRGAHQEARGGQGGDHTLHNSPPKMMLAGPLILDPGGVIGAQVRSQAHISLLTWVALLCYLAPGYPSSASWTCQTDLVEEARRPAQGGEGEHQGVNIVMYYMR